MQHRVSATALYLRSEPRVTSTNGLAVLPHGQLLTAVDANVAPWKAANAVIGGTTISGYVHGSYLTAADQLPSTFNCVAPIHLRENRPEVCPRSAAGRAFPIGDPLRPSLATSDLVGRASQLVNIADYLSVENSARYAARGSTTYCNVYAYDYCYLTGAYLPRVWWKDSAIERLGRGESVAPHYDDTLRELRANDLYDWFTGYGGKFAWSRCFDTDDLQRRVNAGAVGVIVAQQAELGRSGHISVVVPEIVGHAAARTAGKVVRPLQSQAGRINRHYFCGRQSWWQRSNYRAFGFWVAH